MEAVTSLHCGIWNEESLPLSWGLSMIVSIFKDTRMNCSNRYRFGLFPTVTKFLSSKPLRRLTSVLGSNGREKLTGFRSGRGCTD